MDYSTAWEAFWISLNDLSLLLGAPLVLMAIFIWLRERKKPWRHIQGIDIQQALKGSIRTYQDTQIFAGCLILDIPEEFHSQFMEFLQTFQDYTHLCGCRFAFCRMHPDEARSLTAETGFAVRYCLLSYSEQPKHPNELRPAA